MLLSLVVKFVLYFVLWKERKYAKKRLGFVHFLKKEKKGLIGLWADVETKKTRFKKRQKIDENFVSDSPHFPYFNFHTFFLKKNFLEIAFWASFFGRFLHRKSFSLNVRTSAAFCETIKLSKMFNFGKTYFGKLKFSPIFMVPKTQSSWCHSFSVRNFRWYFKFMNRLSVLSPHVVCW